MNVKTLIIVAVVIAALVGLKYAFFPSKSGSSAPPPSGTGAPAGVIVTVVSPENLNNSITATGTLRANEEVLLQPEVSGKVTQLNFTEGSTVAKGQLLVKINDADIQATAGKLLQQYKLATDKLERYKQLVSINAISKEEFDNAQNACTTLKAEMDIVTAQLAKTEIRAPFQGTVGLKNISEGAYVTPSTVIAGIQQTNPIKLDFAVNEQYAGNLHKGQAIQFKTEGHNESFTASILAIDPKIDASTRTVNVRAVCPNPGNVLFPGAFVQVNIGLETIPNSILLPTEAIIPELKGKKVFTVKGGKVVPAKVETGIRNDARIQILSGLNPGDTVIVSGYMQVKPGSNVRISEVK